MSGLLRRLRALLDRTLLTTWRALWEFVEDRGHRDAAQIAFFAVLSAIPLALLLIAAFGALLGEGEVRERVIDTAFTSVPLAQDDDRARLEGVARDALDGAGEIGPVSVVLLIGAAMGVMGALRHSINVAWDIERRPSLLRRKALDLALVSGATIVLLFSLSVTATREASRDLGDDGGGGVVLAAVLDGVGDVLPFLFVAAVVLFLYRILPVDRPRLRDIWPGALVAAAGLLAVKGALELYLEHLADFGALYGSLGALMALLLFVFAGANVLVFGAEFASEWARLPREDAEVARIVGDGRARAMRALRRRGRRSG
jgi:membrane protein